MRSASKYALMWANGASFQEVIDQHARDLASVIRPVGEPSPCCEDHFIVWDALHEAADSLLEE